MKLIYLAFFLLSSVTIQSKVFSNEEYEAVQWFGNTLLSLLLIGVDDKLDEDVKTFLESENLNQWEDNAYIYLWAIDVVSENVYETSLEISQKVINANARYKYEMAPYDSSFLDDYEYIKTSNKDFYCTFSFNDCFSAIYLDIKNALIQLENDYVLYERYHQFFTYKFMSIPYLPKFDAPWPSISNLAYGHQLNQAFMIEKLFNQEHNEFIRLIEEDTKKLKAKLIQAKTGFGKMVILGLIEKNIELAGHLFQLKYLEKNKLISSDILQPFTDSELSGYKMLEFELKTMMRMLQELSENPHYLIKPSDKHMGNAIVKKLMPLVFKSNLTMNSVYHENVYKVLEFSKLGPAEFYNQYESLNVKVNYNYIRAAVSSYLASFISDEKSMYLSYQGRIHSVNMKIQLLKALVEQGSFEKVIEKAEMGYQSYLNHYDQSPPYIDDDKVCYSGLFDFNKKFRCMQILN